MKITSEITGEDDCYVYGKTFVDDEFTTTWCKSKMTGKPPTIEPATGFHYNHTGSPSQEYFDACKRWPLEDPVKEAAWKAKWNERL